MTDQEKQVRSVGEQIGIAEMALRRALVTLNEMHDSGAAYSPVSLSVLRSWAADVVAAASRVQQRLTFR